MASLAENGLRLVHTGLFQRDDELCSRVIEADSKIDELEIGIDETGTHLLLRFHPVAKDMRRVISTMKIGWNIERIADQCTNIARRTRHLILAPRLPETDLLDPMFRFASALLKDSFLALADERPELALEIRARDKELDSLNKETVSNLTAALSAEPANIPTLLHLIFIAGSVERIGDHAKAIAEAAFYIIEAKDIRHSAKSDHKVSS